MSKELNINQWIKKFDNFDFSDANVNTQIDAGWYDWFCKDTSLANKTKALGKKLKMISESKKFSNEKCYVFFKNNCPCVGSLYDDFRICDIESGGVIYIIIPKSGHVSENGLGCVWGRENDFKEPLIKGTWGEIKKWFLEN